MKTQKRLTSTVCEGFKDHLDSELCSAKCFREHLSGCLPVLMLCSLKLLNFAYQITGAIVHKPWSDCFLPNGQKKQKIDRTGRCSGGWSLEDRAAAVWTSSPIFSPGAAKQSVTGRAESDHTVDYSSWTLLDWTGRLPDRSWTGSHSVKKMSFDVCSIVLL